MSIGKSLSLLLQTRFFLCSIDIGTLKTSDVIIIRSRLGFNEGAKFRPHLNIESLQMSIGELSMT